MSSVAIFFNGGVRSVTVKLFYETLPGAIASIPVTRSWASIIVFDAYDRRDINFARFSS